MSVEALMNWAEVSYPHYFAPAGAATLTSGPYTYRYYSATGNYLGVAGQDVYLLGPVSAGQLSRVGGLADFSCRVVPESCSAAGSSASVLFTSNITHGEIARINSLTPQAGSVPAATTFTVANSSVGPGLAYSKKSDQLYLGTTNGYIQVVGQASSARGIVSPVRSILPLGVSLQFFAPLFLDETKDVLYVGGSVNSEDVIAVFESASTINGRVSPSRVIVVPTGVYKFTIDTRRSIAYTQGFLLGVTTIRNIDTLNGRAPSSATTFNLERAAGGEFVLIKGLAVDSARDRLYVATGDGGLRMVENASTAAGVFQRSSVVRFPGANLQFLTLDEPNDRLYIGAYTLAYVVNSASLLTASSVAPAAIRVFSRSGASTGGFAFP